MHGSMWRREETGTSRASTCRAVPGASRRPDRLLGASSDARLRNGPDSTPVGSAGGLDGLHGMADWSGDASRRRFEPCMRFSRTRLTDIVHRLAYAVVGRTVPLRRWTRRLFSHS